MDRLWLVGWMAMVVAGCSDDVAPAVDGSGSSSAGTDDTTFGSLSTGDPTTTLATTVDTSSSDTTTTGTGTTTGDPDSSSSSTASDETDTTGEPLVPFDDAVEIPLAIDFVPLALAMADFDGDGELDLLVTGTDSGIVVGATLLGDGDGGFAAPVDAGVTACSAFPVVGAIDDDGRADLFFGTCDTEAVFYLAGDGGVFEATSVLEPWTASPVRSSRFVDHDADGDDDLVLLTVDDVGAAELHLARHGELASWALESTDIVLAGPTGFEPNGVAIARIDDDGRGDALLLDVDTALAFMRAEPDGAHASAIQVPLDVVPSSVLAFDLQDDGLDDLLVVSRSESVLQLVRNEGDDELVAELPVIAVDEAPLEAVAERFDGDDTVDLAVITGATAGVLLAAGDGTGTFTPGITLTLPSPAVRLLSGDLNGDGVPDLVAATFENGSVTVLLAD